MGWHMDVGDSDDFGWPKNPMGGKGANRMKLKILKTFSQIELGFFSPGMGPPPGEVLGGGTRGVFHESNQKGPQIVFKGGKTFGKI